MTHSHEREIRCGYMPWKGEFELYLYARDTTDGVCTVSAAKPVAMEQVSEMFAGTHSAPMLSLSEAEAQQLMDELWRAGVRPKDGTGSTGQIAAMQLHLDDMRALVFNPLGLANKEPRI